MRISGFLIMSLFIIFGCNSNKNIYNTPAFSTNNAVNSIIEIPAGTNKKIEYNTISKKFDVDQRDGKDRIIPFLPYPANYGFIPSTFSDPKLGGDGDALDILVICEALPTGTIIETIPIGMLKLLDNGEYDYKIIAIPKDPNIRIINITTYEEFIQKYRNVKDILELWFLNYDTKDTLTSEGWGDEKEATREITRSLKQKSRF